MSTTEAPTKKLAGSPKATRAAFGEAILEFADRFPQMVVLDADLSKSTMTASFAKKYNHRHLQMGIAEANMIGTAAGLALVGKIPVMASFACFLVGRFETIRVSIGYNNANVKIIGTHAGLGIGEDGYTQMALEDLACLRSLPNMVLLQPADETETRQAVEWALAHQGPVYMRLTRQNLDPVHETGYRFAMGKADELLAGTQAMIFATGGTVKNALVAAQKLQQAGISCGAVNIHTIKPFDKDYITKITGGKMKLVVACEDHAPDGGLGSAVAEAMAELGCGMRLVRAAAKGYGESGTGVELYKKHGLDADSLVDLVKKNLKG